MTKEEAEKLTHFDYPCTCSGHNWIMNGRRMENPHMDWCQQKPQYDEWYEAMYNE